LPGAINLMNGEKFETWLGSIVSPNESFYLVAQDQDALRLLIEKAAKIGYELLIKGAFVYDAQDGNSVVNFDREAFKKDPGAYTIVDIRNESETKKGLIFDSAINIPLPERRERTGEIPADKPVAVHCAGGYRSAAGSSIIREAVPKTTVFDMSEAINEFK